jgi:enterochelin esterase family protein
MKKLALVLLLATISTFTAAQPKPDKLTAPQIIAIAQSNPAAIHDAIYAAFEPQNLLLGTAWAGHGHDFFFAVYFPYPISLVIDAQDPVPMLKVPSKTPENNQLWYAIAHVEQLGKLHSFHYQFPGGTFGGVLDLPAYTPLSYQQPDVPAGTLSDKITHTSKIYDGMKTSYWTYVPAQYDPKIPAALMVFQDGQGYTDRDPWQKSDHGILNVIDNLIAQHKIPVMICVFINPGSVKDAPGTPTYNYVQAHGQRFNRPLDDAMRSTLYDTVSDRYPRYLRDEILAEVGARYNLRKDAYSHAITGLSSGGICSFNAAWQMPDQFSRVITWIGSFTNIQWEEQPAFPEGGQDYPDKVLRGPKRNIRVWLQDGSNDMENPNWGSWPLANIRMANALKTRDYDFHFSFGRGTHNAGHGAAEFPEEMTWLWRGYDPTKTEETYQPDPAEKSQPFYRVQITSRTAEQ